MSCFQVRRCVRERAIAEELPLWPARDCFDRTWLTSAHKCFGDVAIV